MDSSADGSLMTQGLVAGEDYPDSYRGFVEMFPDDEACLRYIEPSPLA